MELLACGHPALRSEVRLCPHLFGPDAGAAHHRLLRGTGLDADLICAACADATTEPTPVLVEVCEGCAARVADDEWEMLGWRGEPGVLERLAPIAVEHRAVAVDVVPLSDRALAACGDGWLCWTTDGVLVRLDGDGAPIAEHPAPLVEEEPTGFRARIERALHVSPDGRWAACVADRGRFGRVVDLTSGAVVLELDRGTYHPEQTPFPVAFARHETGTGAATVVIAATDWIRLDAWDLATGASLTERPSTAYRRGEPRPPHHLDRFHGRLLVSPTGRWLADDGWVWHPIGVPRTFDLGAWLTVNRWEADDGPSVAALCGRAYHWGAPMCWVGEDLLAIGGIGPDDELMLDGVRLFDVSVPTEVIAFAGPTGRLWGHEGALFSDEPDGLHRWDPLTGERTARLAEVHPHALDPATGTFAALGDGRLRTWRLV